MWRRSAVPNDEIAISRLAPNAEVTGEVDVEGDLRMEGAVDGEVHGRGQVTVADGGAVDGDISAQHIVVAGQVTGTLDAEDRIEIENGAVVSGAMSSPVASIEEGARVDGTVRVGLGAKALVSDLETEALASS